MSDVFSSKPRATSLALVTIRPPFTFSVITHLTEIHFCPEFLTISKTSLSIQLWISCSLASATALLVKILTFQFHLEPQKDL